MEENSNKNIKFQDKVKLIISNNKLKFLTFILLIVGTIISLILLNLNNKKMNEIIAQKYIQAGLYLATNDINNSKNVYEEIIYSKNKFYSILALNTILEKNLEKNEKKILEYFEIIEKIKKTQEQKDLLLFKKALFLLKNSKIDEAKEILNRLIEDDSQLKFLAKEVL